MLVVKSGLVDIGHNAVEKSSQLPNLGLRENLSRTAAVHRQYSNGAAVVHQRQMACCTDFKVFRQLPEDQVVGSFHVRYLQVFVCMIDLGNGELGIVDGKGAIADDIRLVPRCHGAAQSAAGQIFQVDAAGVPTGNEVDSLNQGMQDIIQTLFAEGADFFR